MDVSDLFRQKLGNAEIVPDASVGKILMRKVSVREFLRFNPVRPNIYYLGGAIAVIITAAILFTSSAKNADLKEKSLPNGNEDKIERVNEINDAPFKTSDQKTDDATLKNIVKKPLNNLNNKEAKEPESSQNEGKGERTLIVPANVGDSFSKSGLFPDPSPEMNRLQTGFISEGLLFDVSASEGCSPLKIRFSLKSESGDSCKWTFGDGGYSYEKNPEWIFDIEGDYKVVLQIYDPKGIMASSSTIITVHPKPLARFEVSHDKELLRDNEIRFYNYSTNSVKFKWSFGDGKSSELFEPVYNYSKYGNYNVSLKAFSDYGCTDSLTVMNALSGSEFFIGFPNAFIPNLQGPTGGYYSSKSDEVAQVFHPSSSGVSEFQLKIFSKLGILIFESTDINLGWDGYYKGQLCEPGVYIWKVRGSFSSGEPFTKMGDVTLLKN